MASENNAHLKVVVGEQSVNAVLNFSPLKSEELASDHREKDDIPQKLTECCFLGDYSQNEPAPPDGLLPVNGSLYHGYSSIGHVKDATLCHQITKGYKANCAPGRDMYGSLVESEVQKESGTDLADQAKETGTDKPNDVRCVLASKHINERKDHAYCQVCRADPEYGHKMSNTLHTELATRVPKQSHDKGSVHQGHCASLHRLKDQMLSLVYESCTDVDAHQDCQDIIALAVAKSCDEEDVHVAPRIIMLRIAFINPVTAAGVDTDHAEACLIEGKPVGKKPHSGKLSSGLHVKESGDNHETACESKGVETEGRCHHLAPLHPVGDENVAEGKALGLEGHQTPIVDHADIAEGIGSAYQVLHGEDDTNMSNVKGTKSADASDVGRKPIVSRLDHEGTHAPDVNKLTSCNSCVGDGFSECTLEDQCVTSPQEKSHAYLHLYRRCRVMLSTHKLASLRPALAIKTKDCSSESNQETNRTLGNAKDGQPGKRSVNVCDRLTLCNCPRGLLTLARALDDLKHLCADAHGLPDESKVDPGDHLCDYEGNANTYCLHTDESICANLDDLIGKSYTYCTIDATDRRPELGLTSPVQHYHLPENKEMPEQYPLRDHTAEHTGQICGRPHAQYTTVIVSPDKLVPKNATRYGTASGLDGQKTLKYSCNHLDANGAPNDPGLDVTCRPSTSLLTSCGGNSTAIVDGTCDIACQATSLARSLHHPPISHVNVVNNGVGPDVCIPCVDEAVVSLETDCHSSVCIC